MGFTLRPSGLGRLSGRDENGKKIEVGMSGPGTWTGKDEDGHDVVIRTTETGYSMTRR